MINSFIIVDLQNNLDEEKRNEIEKYILTIDGVRSVRFMDKSESLKIYKMNLTSQYLKQVIHLQTL